jgi:hypothetical protein
MRRDLVGASLVLSLLLASSGRAAAPPCREKCDAERKRVERTLQDCLREVDPTPPDRAAKMRLLCREKFVPPRCEHLPPCAEEKRTPAQAPGMKLGAMVFSAEKRGPALSAPRFAAGRGLHLRLDVEVLPKPKVNRVWLRMGLRMLSLGKQGKKREVTRWDAYAEEQRFIDPAERGLPLRFTLHGGVDLPRDLDLGRYEIEAIVKEKASGFEAQANAEFSVIGHGPRGSR